MKLIFGFIFSLTCISGFSQESDDPFTEYIWHQDTVNNRKLYLNPDKLPEFVDSKETFQDYFIHNFKYASVDCIQSKIVISFVVETNGEVTGKQILNKLKCDIAIEVFNVLDSMPKMKPGLIKGKAVPVKLIYPIMIDLQ